MENKIFSSYKELIDFTKLKTVERENDHENYYEVHHVIPRYQGGSNDKDNLVILTLFEHLQAHYLLMKKYEQIDNVNFLRNLGACSLIISGSNDIQKAKEIEKILNDEKAIKLIESLRLLRRKNGSFMKNRVFVMKDGKRLLIHKDELGNYLAQGWIKQFSEKS